MTIQRNVLAILSVFGALAMATPSIHAQDNLQATKAALIVITDTADKICNQAPPLQGNSSSIELSGEAKAALNGAIGKIVRLGIQGAGKYTSDQYFGVLRKDLANTINQNTNCRLAVFGTLNEKVLILPRETKKSAALDNINVALTDLRHVVIDKSGYLLPSMRDYIEDPTSSNWKIVIHNAERQLKLVDAAVDSVEAYNAQLIGPNTSYSILENLHEDLRRRDSKLRSLLDVPANPPPSVSGALHWAKDYGSLYRELIDEMRSLESAIKDST
jgi:hypothetical protein